MLSYVISGAYPGGLLADSGALLNYQFFFFKTKLASILFIGLQVLQM